MGTPADAGSAASICARAAARASGPPAHSTTSPRSRLQASSMRSGLPPRPLLLPLGRASAGLLPCPGGAESAPHPPASSWAIFPR